MFSLVNKHEEFFDFLVTNAEYFHKGTQMALEVLQDAIAGHDADFAHALGVKARSNGWVDAAEVYTGAYPDTAGSAEALDYLDSNGPGTPAYNMLSSMTFNAPTD